MSFYFPQLDYKLRNYMEESKMNVLQGKQFRVGSMDYVVKIVPQLQNRESLYGRVTYGDGIIEVDADLSDVRKDNVLVHELVHAMLFEAGYDGEEQDEDLVNRLAHVLHAVLRDNDFSFVRRNHDDA